MLIDWFTTAAQVLNFLILVWLMKRFLYKPVLAAIAARETRIAAQLGDAAAKQTAAVEESASYRQKNADFDRERAALMSRAVAHAESEEQRLIALGRVADDAARKGQQAAMENAYERLCAQVSLQVRDEVLGLARSTLAELAETRLEESMVRLFARRVTELGQVERAKLVAAVAANPKAGLVRSALPLDEPLRLAITAALREGGLGVDSLRFEAAARLVCGIEFSVNGWKLAWNVDACLKSIEQRVGALLKAAAVPEAAPASTVQPGDEQTTTEIVAPASPALPESTAAPAKEAAPAPVAAVAGTTSVATP